VNSIAQNFFTALGSLTSPGGSNAALTVLLYHRVLDRADELNPGEPSAAQFDAHMAVLARMFHVLPLDEAISRLEAGTLPARAVSVTFDDGYLDNLEVALPILQRHGVVATFFISTGLIDGGRMMHDTVIETVRRFDAGDAELTWLGLGKRVLGDTASRLALIDEIVGKVKYLPLEERLETCSRLAGMVSDRLPDDLMLSSEQVLDLYRAGMRIGAHTHQHPILAKLTSDQARAQIDRSRDLLADVLGSAPTMFAYPNGKPGLDYTREHVEMVRQAGFGAAVSVSFGTVSRDSDHLQIPRFCPWDRTSWRFALRLVEHPLRHRRPAMA
jgi:peptidoglycan/xylan/chitin deacetylase (PgdA/CDA1 family)